MSGKSRRRALGGVTLVVGGLLAGLLLTEVAYRVGRRFVCLPTHQSYYEPRSWGWTHRPGARLELYGCIGRAVEWQSALQFNTQGLREREVTYEKPTATTRVLVLGDSITEAVQVDAEQTFVRVAETRLRQRDPRIELVNAGHAGFGTDNALLFYREEGRRYRPDLVVLVFNVQNDVLENSATLYRELYARAGVHFPPKPAFDVDADGTLREIGSIAFPSAPTLPWPARLGRAVASQLYVVREIERRLSRPALPRYPPNLDIYAPPDPTWARAWRVTEHLLLAIKAEVERDGSQLAVVVMPSKEMVSPASFENARVFFGLPPHAYDLDRPLQKITAFLAANDVATLDVLPALRERFAATGRTGFFTWDVHLTPEGHAAVAGPTADFVANVLGMPPSP